KPATINVRLIVANKFFEWAAENGHRFDNPVAKVKRVKQPKRLPKYLDKGDIESTFRRMRTDTTFDMRNALIIRLLYYTGMRIGEAAQLKWTQVDLKNGFIKVIGKGNKERIIPIHPK